MELSAQILIAYHWRRYKKRKATKKKQKKKLETAGDKRKSGGIAGGKNQSAELPAHMKK